MTAMTDHTLDQIRSVPSSPLRLLLEFGSELYNYREFLLQSVLRDLRTKYKRSTLGYIWTMLHPLCMMLIIGAVFSHVMKVPIKDYSILLFAGLLPWNYFSSSVMMSLVSIRGNATLFNQVAVPKYIFVLSRILSNLANLFLAVIPLLILMLVAGREISITAFAFPLMLLPLCLTTIGVSLILTSSNVFFGDTHHVTEVGLQAFYFLCPVLYVRDLLPPGLVKYLVWNPVFCEIEFFRAVFYDGRLPTLAVFLANTGLSIVVLICGLFVFRKSEDKFMYFV
jgi:ABC-type polysaccharide/polyol phosphate export permease